MTVHSVADDTDAASVSTAAAADNEEQEPLLSPQQSRQLMQTDVPGALESPLRSDAVPTFAKRLTSLLGLCLAGMCMLIGVYVLYILVHIPKIMLAVHGSDPELDAASLIDAADESILLSARLRFPRRRRRAVRIPFANVTVFHKGDSVGWLSIRDFELEAANPAVELYEVFHIVDQQAMERLVSETVEQRRIAVETRVAVDMSGFGRFLPMVTVRRKVDFALPPPPSVNYTLNGISGPSVDEKNGGVTAHATVSATIPYKGVSANIDPLCFDISFCNTTIATVFAGPVTVSSSGDIDLPSVVNVKSIADDKHEAALALLVRDIAGGKAAKLAVSGAEASLCHSTTAPLWLRRALSKALIPVSIDSARLPAGEFPALGELVKEMVVDRFYASWNASRGFSPWAAVSGQTTVQLPNPYGANFTFEIESLVPRMQLVDDKRRVFATVDAPAIPLRMLQISPLTYSIQYDLDRIGVSVAENRQKQFTHTMQRALVDRHLLVGINGTLDVALATSIGRLRIDALPFYKAIDHVFSSEDKTTSEYAADQGSTALTDGHGANMSMTSGEPKLSVGRIHITDTSEHLVTMEIDVDLDNPFSYGAYLSDMAMHIGFAGLRIARIGVKELAVGQGSNTITIYIDFYNHPEDPRQKMLFLNASSGKPLTIELSGFPNCTTIAPLEASLRGFTQSVTIDPSKLGNGHGGLALGQLPKVLREVIFHVFSLTAEATVVNPVSGAGIWLQAIEAIGYHNGDIPLGTLSYNFMTDTPRRTPASSNGLLLPYNQSVATPRLPITANETSIGWDVVRRAIGGTLDVDVFTNIQVLVGRAQFNVTAMGRNAPVKIRF
ncbi:hypothetical protein LPJ56_001881 [Coemansia sp. RSA 2599]|nr:hypothetical protein LPJ56_001881 [Coemansia sp. RSA 2599]